jgi:hypothetical protein
MKKEHLRAIDVTIVSDSMVMPPQTLRRTYDWMVETWQAIGTPVTEVGVKAPGFAGNHRSFARIRKRLEDSDFALVQSIEVRHCRPGDRNVHGEWTMRANVMAQEHGQTISTATSSATWAINRVDLGISEEGAVDLALQFAKLATTTYGYIFFMSHWSEPDWYAAGIMAHGKSEQTTHEGENGGAWMWSRLERRDRSIYLLRDVYPVNFLSRPYLNLPVNGRTLESTIRSDPRYGTLEPLNEHAMTWRPVIEHIPALREELFRAGIIFYRGFFVPSDPFYRSDYSEPWACPEPIPEFLRADFVAKQGRDPKLTY